jgi:hypothetical protein
MNNLHSPGDQPKAVSGNTCAKNTEFIWRCLWRLRDSEKCSLESVVGYELVGVKSVSLFACITSETIQMKWIKSTIADINIIVTCYLVTRQ